MFDVFEVEVEVYKMNEVFSLAFVRKNSHHVHWNVQTNIKKLYARNNILKKEFKSEILNHLYFGPKFIFG